jgi:P27 family predicted phage terminase small subunit
VTRGRKVDPTRAKRGTGHRPKAGELKIANEPDAILLTSSSGPPPPPADLDHPHAIAVWNEVVGELYPRGLRGIDLEAIRMLASQAALAFDAAHGAEGYRRTGLMVTGANGNPTVNPLVRVERDAANLYLRFSERFGLDVASRMRLGLLQLAGQSLAEALAEDLERE